MLSSSLIVASRDTACSVGTANFIRSVYSFTFCTGSSIFFHCATAVSKLSERKSAMRLLRSLVSMFGVPFFLPPVFTVPFFLPGFSGIICSVVNLYR